MPSIVYINYMLFLPKGDESHGRKWKKGARDITIGFTTRDYYFIGTKESSQ